MTEPVTKKVSALPVVSTIQDGDKLVGERVDGTTVLIPYVASGSGGSSAVNSVNGKTGTVVINPDDLSDTSSTHKFTTASDISKLAGIASGAQVNTVTSVNTQTGTVVLTADSISDSTSTHKFTTASDITKLAAISGTNTGDQNIFNTMAVSGQTSVTPASTNSTLNFVAGSNVTLTTDNTTKSITIASSGGGGGGSITSVNGYTGVVVLNSDDISDTARTHKFTTASDITKLAAISGTNTGDQTITLTGGVTGSGTGSFAATVVTNANLTGTVTSVGNATSIAAGAISNTMLANSAVANLSGTNSGNQNLFNSYAVSGQTSVTPASTSSTLTLVAGTNVTMTTDNTAKSITISASGGGGSSFPGASTLAFVSIGF